MTVFGLCRYDGVMPDDADQLLTSHEVAKIFRVDERTVRRWAATGALDDCTVYTPGGRLRYRADRIRARANYTPQTSRPGTPTPPDAGPGLTTNPAPKDPQ